MRRKLLLGVVLCLAATAVLGIGAVPAYAQDGCDCHTAVPPTNGAPAAHAPYVASITDCTVCHKAWSPHPDAASVVPSTLGLSAAGTPLTLVGKYAVNGKGRNGVIVHLQQRLWGAVEFSDLGQVPTWGIAFGGSQGSYRYVVPSPTPWAAYRAIAEGMAGPPAVTPSKAVWLPTPDLTIAIRGLDVGMFTPAHVRLGRTLTVSGTVKPADLGGKVTIRVKKRVAGEWVTRFAVKRAISDTGTYSWKWTPKTRGQFRVVARIPATAAHKGVVTRWARLNWPTISVY